jgi:hypothetical protein
VSEAAFFQVYGNLFSLYVADKHEAEARAEAGVVDRRELPYVKEALASTTRGGYPAALARCAYLLKRKGEPLPLARLELKRDLMADYRELIPQIAPDERRRIRGEQEIIVNYEPERALETLPELVADPADRARLVELLPRLLTDERVQRLGATREQEAMLARIRQVLGMPQSGAPASVKRGA